MFRTILRMLSVVWIILITASAVAQDKGFKIKDRYQVEGGGKKWALIIGINSYQDQAISDLQYAVNDAERLHQLLVDPEHRVTRMYLVIIRLHCSLTSQLSN